MNAERLARALRRLMLRTARSPLRPLWAALYAVIARAIALAVAPRRSQATVFLAGSLASGEPVHGVSDIDLVAVARDDSEARHVRRRFDALARRLPPLRILVPDFSVYDEAGLERAIAGPYPVNGLADGRALFLGPDAFRDEGGLLDRPGLHGGPEWRRLRGTFQLPEPHENEPLVAAWLELQTRWRWALHACRSTEPQRSGVALVSEAARIWLWLAHGERHRGRRAPIERALQLVPGERDGLIHALDVLERLHRVPDASLERLLACFAGLSEAIARLVEETAAARGVTEVRLLGSGGPPSPGVALLDWRALVLPAVDWSTPSLPDVVEERLVAVDADPSDPDALSAAAAGEATGHVPALRHGSLLVEPTLDVWGRGRLRTVQCRASDPVSWALLEGRDRAAFPEVAGWSAHDWAQRAVAEHRAWLHAGRAGVRTPHWWIRRWPGAVSSTPAALGLLLSAARAARFLDSVAEGAPELPLAPADLRSALAGGDPGFAADAGEALEALEESRRERRPPPGELVGHFRRRVESMRAYASPRRPAAAVGNGRSAARANGGQLRIRRGANVSHWLSQTWWMTEPERARGFAPDDAQRMRELGLDHVRLPVERRWLWHADGRLDPRGLERLESTIDWCRAAELAVVVSLHAPEQAQRADELADLWRDLAGILGERPLDEVAYELLGEPVLPDDEDWNRVASACLAALRDLEPERTVVLDGNRRSAHAALPALEVPDDPHLLLAFHYYEPRLLTHYRAEWIPECAEYDGPVGHYDGVRIRDDLAVPIAVAQRSGRPLYCGEFGVIDTVPDEPRLRWYRDVIDALEENEIAWSAWDLRGRFGLYGPDGPTIAHQAIAERRFGS